MGLPFVKREPVDIERRKPLTKKQRAELAVRQEGLCGCGCGKKLNHLTEGTIDEHVLPLWCGGTNDLDNRQLWRKPCAAKKTAQEAKERGHIKRIIKKSDPATRKPPRLKSRGFDRTLRKKMNGSVERRT